MSFINFLRSFFVNKPTSASIAASISSAKTEAPKTPSPVRPPLNPKKDKMLKVINAFETGGTSVDYSSLYFFYDGPNQIKQITLGRGFTEFGSLVKVVEDYANANGIYSNFFKKYVGRIGKQPSLRHDKEFLDTLKRAGSDPVMQAVQDKIFEERYWIPAEKFFKDNGFTLPLSQLVIFDSYVHSGGILSFLRKRFPEVPPVKGGDEKKWIEQYVNTRHDWLATHKTVPVLRNTIYRTNCFKDLIKKNDWNLDGVINANGILV